MKKILLAPDSFKGTMTAAEVSSIMAKAVARNCPGAEAVQIPVADGGEGSVDCFCTALGGEKIFTKVTGPLFEEVEAFYGLLPDQTAIIEMAAAAGLPLVEGRQSAENTTTYGVGQLIAHALGKGCKKLIIGLGGSATNDGGAGCASALGIRFLNSKGGCFVPTGKTLQEIAAVDMSRKLDKIDGVSITVMSDIDNPLCGTEGAAYRFAPQKGADGATVELLDRGLAHLADLVQKDLGKDIRNLKGAGAAGGMGGGLVAFLGAEMQMGIDTVLDTVQFDKLLQGADIVFSGEGRIDGQSLRGKVISGIAKRTQPQKIPLVAVVGGIGDDLDWEAAARLGISGIFSINLDALSLSEAKRRSRHNLAYTMDNLIRYTRTIQNSG